MTTTPPPPPPPQEAPPTLLTLPPELRLQIYSHLFTSAHCTGYQDLIRRDFPTRTRLSLSLLLTSRLLHHEASTLAFSRTTFRLPVPTSSGTSTSNPDTSTDTDIFALTRLHCLRPHLSASITTLAIPAQSTRQDQLHALLDTLSTASIPLKPKTLVVLLDVSRTQYMYFPMSSTAKKGQIAETLRSIVEMYCGRRVGVKELVLACFRVSCIDVELLVREVVGRGFRDLLVGEGEGGGRRVLRFRLCKTGGGSDVCCITFWEECVRG